MLCGGLQLVTHGRWCLAYWWKCPHGSFSVQAFSSNPLLYFSLWGGQINKIPVYSKHLVITNLLSLPCWVYPSNVWTFLIQKEMGIIKSPTITQTPIVGFAFQTVFFYHRLLCEAYPMSPGFLLAEANTVPWKKCQCQAEVLLIRINHQHDFSLNLNSTIEILKFFFICFVSCSKSRLPCAVCAGI